MDECSTALLENIGIYNTLEGGLDRIPGCRWKEKREEGGGEKAAQTSLT